VGCEGANVNQRAGEALARVVVTGGSGKLGRACVADLVAHDWDVVVFDKIRSSGLADDVTAAITFVPIDLTDCGQVLDAMLGVEGRYERVDALVHLGFKTPSQALAEVLR
jgi:NAD(P)-dependent dehydrogenase (short-subunit alcohol dehydrogenase family)